MARFSVSDRTRHVSKSEAMRLLETGRYYIDLANLRRLLRLTHSEIVAARPTSAQFSYIPEVLPSAEIPGLQYQRARTAGDVLGHVFFPKAQDIQAIAEESNG